MFAPSDAFDVIHDIAQSARLDGANRRYLHNLTAIMHQLLSSH